MKTAKEILSKKYAEVGHFNFCDLDTLSVMEEYARQFVPVLPTDEEIEKEFPTSTGLFLTGTQGEVLTKSVEIPREQIGAKWLRDKIKKQIEK